MISKEFQNRIVIYNIFKISTSSRIVKVTKDGKTEEKEKIIDNRLPAYLFRDKYINIIII